MWGGGGGEGEGERQRERELSHERIGNAHLDIAAIVILTASVLQFCIKNRPVLIIDLCSHHFPSGIICALSP